jgi:hypothetical protein
MLKSPVFFVRFYRHHLIAVLRDLAFDRTDFRFEFLSIALIVFDSLFNGFQTRLGGLQLFVERLGDRGEFVYSGSKFLDGNIDSL